MSTYEDLLNIIANLSSDTVFEITQDWCLAQGLNVNANLPKSFGLKFAKEYQNFGVVKISNGSDRHTLYKKK